MRPGARLPATRDLANQYRLSRGTIVAAFEQLKSEGYVEGSVGSGTFVSRVLPDELLQVAKNSSKDIHPHERPRRRFSQYGQHVKLFPNFSIRPSKAFRANLPALDLFPIDEWARLASRRLRKASTNFLLGSGPLGYDPLREAVADYLNASRGVKCVAEQVVILSGVQEALDITARLFLDPSDCVYVENPGYPGASMAFEALGAKVVALPSDQEGMKLRGSQSRNVKLIYVTPGHQFPLGITMTLARRLELLEFARKCGALILEDDYDSEYRYSGRPVPALQGLDQQGHVLFAGSFSKVLFPSLRLGYLVVPKDLLDSFRAVKSVTNRHAPLFEQAVLCDFITEGHFGRHIRRMRQVYAERLSALLESAKQKLTGLVEISGIEAGLQTVGWLTCDIDGETASGAAAKHGVESIPLSRYARGKFQREGLQLGFAAVDIPEIQRGAAELAEALKVELKKKLRKKPNL